MSSDDPLVSVVMPAFNVAPFVAEAVLSVRDQTLRSFELIAIDDGSTDGTGDILDRLAADWPQGPSRLRVLRRSNGGASAARNAGLEVARGALIAFFDADDRLRPDALARLADHLAAHPELDLTFPLVDYIDEDGRGIGFRSAAPKARFDLADIVAANPIHSATGAMVRREAAAAAGSFDETLEACVDFDFWVRVAALRAGNVGCVGAALADYRRRSGQITGDWRRMERNWMRVFEKARALAPDAVAPVRRRARAGRCVFWSTIAYMNGEHPAARRLIAEAWRLAPGMLVRRPDARLRTAACLASLLPEPAHRRLRAGVGAWRSGGAQADAPPRPGDPAPATGTADGPLVSVVMPVHQAAGFVEEAVETVRRQSWRDLELIAVDDGSTDGSAEALARAAARGWSAPGRRIEIVRQTNRGAAAARNAGLRAAKGDWIAFLDADDRYDERFVERLMAFLDARPELDGAFALYRYIDADGAEVGRQAAAPARVFGAAELLTHSFIHAPVVRAEAVREVGGCDETLTGCVDVDLFARIAIRRGRGVGLAPELLSDYRRSSGQITGDWRRMEANWTRVMDKTRAAAPELAARIAVEARARHCVWWSTIAYARGEHAAARRLCAEAWAREPLRMLGDRRAIVRALACLASLLPPRLHSDLRSGFNSLRTRLGLDFS